MSTITMTAPKKFQWRTLILFAILAIPASLAVLPYSLALSDPSMLQPPAGGSQLSPEMMKVVIYSVMMLFTAGQALVINVPLTALGLLFARWTGLDAPFIRALLYREPMPSGIGRSLLVGIVTGAIAGVLLLVLSEYVFGPILESSMEAAGVTFPDIIWTPLEGLLASIGAAFNEEVLLRLFLLNGIAWFGSWLFGRRSGRPSLLVLWVANVLSTIVFGLIHIPNLMLIGVPVDIWTVSSTLAMNGIIGLLCGWLYWKYGLESAIAAHFAAGVVLKVISLIFL